MRGERRLQVDVGVSCSTGGGDSLGTGVGCHFLLQGIFPTQGSNPHLLRLLLSITWWFSLQSFGLSIEGPRLVFWLGFLFSFLIISISICFLTSVECFWINASVAASAVNNLQYPFQKTDLEISTMWVVITGGAACPVVSGQRDRKGPAPGNPAFTRWGG